MRAAPRREDLEGIKVGQARPRSDHFCAWRFRPSGRIFAGRNTSHGSHSSNRRINRRSTTFCSHSKSRFRNRRIGQQSGLSQRTVFPLAPYSNSISQAGCIFPETVAEQETKGGRKTGKCRLTLEGPMTGGHTDPSFITQVAHALLGFRRAIHSISAPAEKTLRRSRRPHRQRNSSPREQTRPGRDRPQMSRSDF